MQLPADCANRALDSAGIDFTIGDLEEGTKPAQVCLRAYGNCLRQLLRAAHWQFARVQLPLVLLADATGQTKNVGQIVPIPWQYEYAYPADCMKVRFIPWNYGQNVVVPANNIQIPNVPLTGVPTAANIHQRIRPARFLVGTDPNFPAMPGSAFWEVQGSTPAGSTVIMTNVPQAICVYTAFMPYPSAWDPLFWEAMVAYLSSEIALPLAKMSVVGPKQALQLRKENIEIAKAKIQAARVTDGNEMFASSDIKVDWMNTRRSGGWRGHGFGGWDDGPGDCYGGWDSIGFCDGSSF